jgi:predicted lipoprotein with Yx(FWY)xxD motif
VDTITTRILIPTPTPTPEAATIIVATILGVAATTMQIAIGPIMTVKAVRTMMAKAATGLELHTTKTSTKGKTR